MPLVWLLVGYVIGRVVGATHRPREEPEVTDVIYLDHHRRNGPRPTGA